MRKAGFLPPLQRGVTCAALAVLLLAQTARAFVVDSTADAADATPGDGICASASSGCTLRAAVEEANATPGPDQVQLEWKTYVRTIATALEVTDDLSIFGPIDVARIDAAGLGRVLHVHPGVTLGLTNVIVQHGVDASPQGGAGILNEGTLHLSRVAVSENTGSFGAGIRNTGSLVIDEGYIIYNGPGAGIDNDGSATIRNCEIARQDGVGLVNRGTAALEFAQIDHNAGGGIVSDSLSVAFPAWIELHRSVLVANTGGGALATRGTAYVKRTTVSGNSGGNASAIYVRDGTLTLEDATIGANGRPDLPAAALDGVGSATVKALNTIVGGNLSSMGDPDCRVVVTSFGHNLMSCPLAAPDPTTVTGDPRLAPLKAMRVVWPANGRTTLVHGLLPGSPALGAGTSVAGWPDQRGVNRTPGTAVDIGALESEPLCTGGAGMTGTRMSIRRRADGTTTIKVRGRLDFTDPLVPTLDPPADGLQLRVEEASSPGGAILERTDLTEPLTGVDVGCGGWRADGSGTRFKWRSTVVGEPLCAPGHSGRLVIVLRDARASGGTIDFAAVATAPMPAVVGPLLRVTVVFGGDPLGDSAAGPAGACAARVFTCASDGSGTRFRCS